MCALLCHPLCRLWMWNGFCTLLFWGAPKFTGPWRKCLTRPRPHNRKLKVEWTCTLVRLCVCVSKSETSRLLNTNTDILVDSVSGYGLTLSYCLCPSEFGGNGGLCAGGALITLSSFWEHGATPPLPGRHKHTPLILIFLYTLYKFLHLTWILTSYISNCWRSNTNFFRVFYVFCYAFLTSRMIFSWF